ncbi:hypothetical protein BDN70DRAFT_679573 [Pholiota conissans]|uniref:Putative gamma-glutamylcyclotransferase n=1 Tax=Pholiota conissans TaxID=109636 RepID=A0A9P5ZDL3_9AGAR|nr:hypothetical protein BDN70DRAFT_679573 [Pholiota conissans]
MKTYNSFFYGTLMHPKILKAVIKNDGSHLQLSPAVILDYTRHKVKGADYPGVLPFKRGEKLFTHTLSREERSVRGTLVKGLTEQDIKYLDEFEGTEYTREPVEAHPLEPFVDLSSHPDDDQDLIPSHPPPLPETFESSASIHAETYIYLDEKALEAELWSFEDFVKSDRARKWYDGTRW